MNEVQRTAKSDWGLRPGQKMPYPIQPLKVYSMIVGGDESYNSKTTWGQIIKKKRGCKWPPV